MSTIIKETKQKKNVGLVYTDPSSSKDSCIYSNYNILYNTYYLLYSRGGARRKTPCSKTMRWRQRRIQLTDRRSFVWQIRPSAKCNLDVILLRLLSALSLLSESTAGAFARVNAFHRCLTGGVPPYNNIFPRLRTPSFLDDVNSSWANH